MTTELDNYNIPRKYPGNDALAQLKPGESESVGALYSAHHANAQANRRIAHLIGDLWGVNYLAAGPGVQGTMRQAGRQGLIECGGDLDAAEGPIEKTKEGPK